MSRNVPAEILALAQLAQVEVTEIQHFIAGLSGSGDITFDVPGDHCAVVVAIEDFNRDVSLAATVTRAQGGASLTEALAAPWASGSDVFYVFPKGLKAKITLAATPVGGTTYFARAIGYFLPYSAYPRLSRMSTRILG